MVKRSIRRWHLEVGALPLAMQVSSAEWASDEEPLRQRMNEIPKHLIKHLSSSTGVELLEIPDSDEFELSNYGEDDKEQVLLTGQCLDKTIFNVHIPRQLQQRSRKPPPSAKVPEQFTVIYDGFLFGVLLEISDNGYEYDAGYVIRRHLAESIFSGISPFNPHVIGPSPLHIALEVVVKYTELPREEIRFYRNENGYREIRAEIDWPAGTEIDLKWLAGAIWNDIDYPVMSFYELMRYRNKILDLYVKALSRFTELQEAYIRMINSAWYNVLERRRDSKLIMHAAADIHAILAEHSVATTDLESGVRELKNTKSWKGSETMEVYFLSQLRPERINYEIFLSGLEHIRAHMLSKGQNVWLLVAAIAGSILTVAGFLITK